VDDEKNIPEGMKGPEGEQVTIAHITRNRDSLKRMLS
jgi:hypothetical protein